ncbi:MAG: sulfotransferase [Candidatus Binatia bacterium]
MLPIAGASIRVLYITGWGRSGSTLLGDILGQIQGFFHAGELCLIWERGIIENRLCGCGSRLKECVVWKNIFSEFFAGTEQVDPYKMVRLRERGARTHHIPFMLMLGGKSLIKSRMREFLAVLEGLYQTVQTRTGSRIIVDSSKFPSYGYLLGMIPTIDLYIVHLIRDSRGTAYSWGGRKMLYPDSQGPTYFRQYSPLGSAVRWSVKNVAAEMLWKHSRGRYLRLRYEDFIQDPHAAVRRILDLVEEQASRLPFVTPNTVELKSNHTVSGNPDRFQRGAVELVPDQRWKVGMKKKDRILVTALTSFLLLRYGYI